MASPSSSTACPAAVEAASTPTENTYRPRKATSTRHHVRPPPCRSAPSRPLNCWDVASAQAIAPVFPALATSSHAIAGATGYQDGQGLPFESLASLVERIAGSIDRPLSVDLEAGYADTPSDVAINVRAIIDAGAIGINLEDSIVEGKRQMAVPRPRSRNPRRPRRGRRRRPAAVLAHARTDAFLLRTGDNEACFAEALRRGTRYAEAGATPSSSRSYWISMSSRGSPASSRFPSTSWPCPVCHPSQPWKDRACAASASARGQPRRRTWRSARRPPARPDGEYGSFLLPAA